MHYLPTRSSWYCIQSHSYYYLRSSRLAVKLHINNTKTRASFKAKSLYILFFQITLIVGDFFVHCIKTYLYMRSLIWIKFICQAIQKLYCTNAVLRIFSHVKDLVPHILILCIYRTPLLIMNFKKIISPIKGGLILKVVCNCLIYVIYKLLT